jgi:transposase
MARHNCPGCREREARITALQERVHALEAEVRDLRARLGQNARNSSVPPSANPAGAPKPVVKQPTGRKPGAQPGHPAHLRRRRLPPERLHRVIHIVPRHCERCQAPLPAQASPHDPEPSWHQVAELPELAAQVTEYQGHFRTCPGCGTVSHAPIPAEVRAHSTGPRLAATLAYLAGCHHVSKRGLEEVVETVFEVPLALGTVSHLEQQMSDALAPAHAEAVAAVREAPVKHVDETGWKQAGQRCWLWVAATATVAAFLIHGRRNLTALKALVGESLYGILCSDRWSVYNAWPALRRQVCWAHLKRDFRKCRERGGEGERIGKAGLKAVRRVFEEWHLFRGGGIDRATLIERLDPVAARLHRVLEGGCACADTKVATFCANVLGIVPALWRFVVTEGIEPTNNHAERLLRRGVLWRKNAFGCHSAAGCRFVERILTVVQTVRLQERSVLGYLYEAIVAHRAGSPAPKLLSAG